MSHALLHLEFAPRARRLSVASQILLLASALILGLCLLALSRSLGEHAQQSDLLAAASKPRGPVAPARPTRLDPRDLERAQLVRRTAHNMATPWSDLLAALEATPSTVALLSVEPSASKRSVTLTAEAASPAQMLAYLHTLQDDSRLHGVVLVSHQLQTQSPGTPLRFQLEGQWGDAP